MKVVLIGATLSVVSGATSAFVPNQIIQNDKKLTIRKSTMEANNDIDIIGMSDGEEYMSPSLLPPVYNREAIASHRLSPMDTQRAIVDVKKFVENRLETDLNLIKVSTFCAPLPSRVFLVYFSNTSSPTNTILACGTHCIPPRDRHQR